MINETCRVCALKEECEYIYVDFCPYGLKDEEKLWIKIFVTIH